MTHTASSASRATVRLELACDLREVRRGANIITEFLTAQGVGLRDRQECELALVEACNNAIQHGCPPGQPGVVEVEAFCAAHEVELRVTDHGPGFPWPERVELPPSESERGRGLYLITALMHRVEYLRNPRGNTLLMRKKRSP